MSEKEILIKLIQDTDDTDLLHLIYVYVLALTGR